MAVVTARLQWIEQMLACLRRLPLDDRDAFFADERNLWAAESCLRRALEALLDLGRHILAKGFASAAAENKEVARQLGEQRVLTPPEAALLTQLAGYRNRLVHFYHEVTAEELVQICAHQLGDVEAIADAYRRWVREHPELVDESL
jgi:uncharacterized protein YutE (UPF0331/DUF86 family)